MTKNIEELLTKLPKVFKRDAYIIGYTYCIGGEESEKLNAGSFICILNSDYSKDLEEMYPDTEVIHIKDIRKAKTDILEYIETDISDISNIKDNLNKVTKYIKNIDSWKSLKIYDADGTSIFDNNYIVNIPNETTDVVISSEMFPLISKKLSPCISYNLRLDKEKGIYNLATLIDLPYFQIQSIFMYLKISD